MDDLFGLDMNIIMIATLVAFIGIVSAVGFTALLNRVMFKIGVRNIPRRPAQTVLIIIGLMLSTLIISAAMGTGDTLNFSIRNDVITSLGEIDEVLTGNRGLLLGGGRIQAFSDPYFSVEKFDELRNALLGEDRVDGIAPMIAESAPVINPVARQSAGSMRITALDPAFVGVFGPIVNMSGDIVLLEDLTGNEVFINEEAAEELEASPGDTLTLLVQGRNIALIVRDVVRKGGLAGRNETTLLSLAAAQEIFEKPGEINSILISNRGNSEDGADLSDEVTELLRGLLTNPDVADQIVGILDDPQIIENVRARAEGQPDDLHSDLLTVADLLVVGEITSELVNLLADEEVAVHLMLATEVLGDRQITIGLFTLFTELNNLNVRDIKSDLLDIASLAASVISSFFVIFGSFSIMAGIMLIFLIFVMLAAERKPEMGIARAVGMKRRHLIQSFVHEGLTYDLLSALVGATIGVGVGFLIVTIMANIFGGLDDNFVLTRHYTLRSFIVSYCAGVTLTFITVFFSSYRSSRLNIVSAIRDLPDTFAPSTSESKLLILKRAIIRPLTQIGRAYSNLREFHIVGFVWTLFLVGLIPVTWPLGILWAILRMFSPAMSQGWLTAIFGILLIFLGVRVEQAAPFTIGVTLVLIGVGFMMRRLFKSRPWTPSTQSRLTGIAILAMSTFWLAIGIGKGEAFTITLAIIVMAFELIRQVSMSRERVLIDSEDRNAFSFIGLSLILFWGTPFDALDFVVPELGSSIEMFLISGVCMVSAAVWVVIYNTDLITNAITAVLGRYSKIRPSLKMAIAYPLDSRLRTGLTLAMLSLVIFTLVVMSMLTTSFGSVLEDVESVTGGWDIVVSVSFNNPVEDFESELAAALGDQASLIEAVGGYAAVPVEARQVGAESDEWKSYRIQGTDQGFFEHNRHDFSLMGEDYDTKEEIWNAMLNDPTLAVVDAFVVPSRDGGGRIDFGGPEFKMEGFFLEDDELPPTEIEVRDPRSGVVVRLTVIGVLEPLADNSNDARVMISQKLVASKSVLDQISAEPIPLTTYRISVTPGADVPAIARKIEASFLQNGLESFVLEEEIAEDRAANLAFNRLFQGFMATGLLVGIAALGVISFRAVVERRQQIGVLKAIGYRQSMILTSFLMESSFIALLGIFIGVGLGTLLSFNLINDIAEEIPGMRFSVPWIEISVIVSIAYLFSLIMTLVPARQASKIYPAEALRYE